MTPCRQCFVSLHLCDLLYPYSLINEQGKKRRRRRIKYIAEANLIVLMNMEMAWRWFYFSQIPTDDDEGIYFILKVVKKRWLMNETQGKRGNMAIQLLLLKLWLNYN